MSGLRLGLVYDYSVSGLGLVYSYSVSELGLVYSSRVWATQRDMIVLFPCFLFASTNVLGTVDCVLTCFNHLAFVRLLRMSHVCFHRSNRYDGVSTKKNRNKPKEANGSLEMEMVS